MCSGPTCLRGSLPRSPTSNVFSQEMWVILARDVSICCFLQAARWARGSQVSTFLWISNSLNWTDYQSSSSGARLSFHEKCSSNMSPSHTLDLSIHLIYCSVRLLCCVRCFWRLRGVLQDVGICHHCLVPAGGRTGCCPRDQVSDTPGRHPTSGHIRKVDEGALRLMGSLRQRSWAR